MSTPGLDHEFYDEAAKERQKESGKVHGKGQSKLPEKLPEPIDSRDAVGKAVGVSGRMVDYAREVASRGIPELSDVALTTNPLPGETAPVSIPLIRANYPAT